MRHSKLWAWVGIGCLVTGTAVATATELNSGTAGPAKCVSWSTEAKMDAYGYDHYVTLESKCAAAVTCEVKTTTNPQATSATVRPGSSVRLLIWRGSPARELTAEVTCQAAP